ncbi:cytotoxic T-lymphocyte protein 4-like [Scyliorhinus canicula]|uniref:cytotoxic T-lymphocyte protein 4-like n=1 Tax=Scyliorhinus canicula TaxID=7830 RepID=UPI0018F5F313|nr:cytotoxic T-lymphocyte protein 4-like [Scyliorhinus canicula]
MNCWINSLSLDRRIEWMKTSQNRITNVLTSRGNTNRTYPNYANRTKYFLNDSISILSISRINLNDTGVYVCEVLVEIPGPVYRKFGNGTHLQVHVIKNSATSSNVSITDSTRWVLISCISAITLIVPVTTFFLARKLMKKDEPVYVNVKYRNKAGQNCRPTEQRNVKYTTSSNCGDVKTVN